jgi:hypothetical protein
MLLTATTYGSYDDYFEVYAVLGCPADSAARCKGTVILSVRGGRRLVSKRFNIGPGWTGRPGREITEETHYALAARDLRVTFRYRTPAGRVRTLSRVFDTPLDHNNSE